MSKLLNGEKYFKILREKLINIKVFSIIKVINGAYGVQTNKAEFKN